MTPHTPEEWNPFAILGNTMPPRDPEEDEEDGDEEEEEEEEDEEDEEARWTRTAVLPRGSDRASVPAAQDNQIRSPLDHFLLLQLNIAEFVEFYTRRAQQLSLRLG